MGAPWAQIGAGISKTAGQTGAGIFDIWGANKTADILKGANKQARQDLTQGYNQAQGYQQPIYDTALNNYQGLTNTYADGGFQTQAPQQFQWDPNQVFQDPEYQASMRAGTEAINRNAYTRGNLFSGTNNRDLNQFGQDLFARRSDALYNRGFNAQNMAFNQDLAANNQNFGQGLALTQPLGAAANNLSMLGLGRGSDLAANTMERGGIRAGNWNNVFGSLSRFSNQQGQNGADFFNSFDLGMG